MGGYESKTLRSGQPTPLVLIIPPVTQVAFYNPFLLLWGFFLLFLFFVDRVGRGKPAPFMTDFLTWTFHLPVHGTDPDYGFLYPFTSR